MSIIGAIIAILFLCFIGYSVIVGFGLLRKENKLLAFACSYGLGVGLIAMQLYLYARVGIPWNLFSIIIPWILFCFIILIRSKNLLEFFSFRLPKLRRLQIILLIGIAFAIGYTVFEALLRPVAAWDAWVTWLLKSKVFFIEGTITPDILNYVKVNYPLVINLLGTFVYYIIGYVDDTAVLLTSFAFYAFTALLLFAGLKKDYGITYALLFTFLLVTTQNFVRHGGRYEAGLADLPLGYYTFACVLLLLEYLKNSSAKTFFLLNVLLGITALIKYEGLPIVIVIELFAFWHIVRRRYYSHCWYLFLGLMPSIDWQIYQKINHLNDSYFSTHQPDITLAKTINAVVGTVKEMVNIKSWNLLWIIYFYSLITSKIKNNTTFLLHSVILSQIGIYVAMFIFTAANNPEGSIERLLMHVAPVVFLYIAINSQRLFGNRFGIITLNEKSKTSKSKRVRK